MLKTREDVTIIRIAKIYEDITLIRNNNYK